MAGGARSVWFGAEGFRGAASLNPSGCWPN